MEPHSPSNDTLKEWRESNLSASDIIWGNLTVSVSKTWQKKKKKPSHLEPSTVKTFINIFNQLLQLRWEFWKYELTQVIALFYPSITGAFHSLLFINVSHSESLHKEGDKSTENIKYELKGKTLFVSQQISNFHFYSIVYSKKERARHTFLCMVVKFYTFLFF